MYDPQNSVYKIVCIYKGAGDETTRAAANVSIEKNKKTSVSKHC